jgi:tetratricopeptide (TPR) repeat protein
MSESLSRDIKQYMQHKKYTKGEALSAEELESISEKLIQAKLDRDKRKEWEQTLKTDYDVEKEALQKEQPFKFSKLAIAAAIMCITGIIAYSIAIFATPNYDTLVNKSIENVNIIDNLVTRGNETVDTQVLTAITAYKNKEYDKSIANWEAIIATGNIKGTTYYNLALCYLHKETLDSQKAIEYLLEARKTKIVQEESNWALALTYMKTNQKEEAKAILQKIINEKAYKYKKAEKLLKLL